ncbi:MAG: hypothetical protein ACYTGZ_21870 [Planctomycetota bacterium]
MTPYTSGLVVEDSTSSSSPLFFASRRTHGSGGSFRGPSGGVPPGLREPSDPNDAPPPPAAPATPGPHGGPTTPGGPRPSDATVSKALRLLKEEARLHTTNDRSIAADKTFRWDNDRGWVDTAWDGKKKPKEIVAFSKTYFDLLKLDPKIARYLAVGKWVTFEFKETVYWVKPE